MLPSLLKKWMYLFLLPVLCLAGFPLRAQQQVHGKVTSEAGESLPGITVFSFIGFQIQEGLLGNCTTLEVKLAPDVQALNEVVVMALGIKREVKALTYTFSKQVKAQLI